MAVWYCEVNGAQEGPLSSSQLIAKIREGEVDKDTPVRKDDSQWVAAIEINGLFAAASKPIMRKLCPYCEALIQSSPPCECPGCSRQIHRVVNRSEPSPVLANGEPNPEARGGQGGVGIKRWVKKLFD